MKRLLLFFAFILCINFTFSQTWGIVGSSTPNGWGGPDLPMTYNVDLDIWEATVEFTNGEIKFRADNNWDNNYGDNDYDGSLEPGGANIYVSAGYYRVSLNLTTLTYTLEPFEFLLGGSWKIASETGALKVGSTEGSDEWWYLNRDQDDITARACYFDDEYVFNLDGSFQNVLGEETWLESWQAGTEQCGTPLAPHDGTVPATFSYNHITGTITINGEGAYLGLPVATNDGLLNNGVPVPESITYNVIFSENNNVMTVSIEAGTGVFWTYKFISDRVVSIPDESFEQALLDLGIDTDGALNHLISKVDAESVTELNVNDLGISSLIGIEAFSNLEILYCQRNQLTSLDVSKNLALTNLECETNQFTALDLSQNVNLKVIGCAQNNLSELDVSQNLLLEAIWCADNNISELNLEVNTKLKVYGLFNNPLTSLSIKNGNNHNIVYSNMTSLPSLLCITVDSESADNSNLDLDPNVIISNNCSGVITIPDPIFEQALIDLEFDTDDTVNGEISQVDAENIYSLDIVGLGINDLSGIEYFVNLEQLFCNNNNLTELQLNTHPNLNGIWMNNNPVTSINLKNCPSLVYLHISQNQLVNIDISNNPLLMELSIANNNLTSLDVSNNPNLTFLRANGNDLYSINIENGNNLNFVAPDWWAYSFDVRFNNNLTCIQVDAGIVNNIPEDWAKENSTFYSEVACNDVVPIPDANFEQALIDLGIDSNGNSGDVLKRDIHLITNLNLNNKEISSLQGLEAFINLTYLNVWGNPIGSLDISMLPELETLWCGRNGLSNLDLSQNTKLKNLYAWTNQLTSLNTSNNPLLEDLQLGENQLTGLDLSNNTLLTNVEIHKNAFTSIDLSANILLTQFWAWENQLTGLDLSKNGALNHIRIQDNLALSYLNVKNGNNENIDNFYVSNTPKLSCITSDAVVSDVMTTYAEGRLSEDCGTVYIPDENFEQTLIDIGIDSDGEVNSLVAKTDVEAVSSLNLTNPLFDPNSGFANPLITNVTGKIKDLTGIEDFVNVTNLQLGYGALSSIDISKNTLLEELFLNDNELSTIDVSSNTLLKRLGVMRNPVIATLDVSNNLLLEELFIDNTAINSIDVSKNENLWKFYARWGILTGIDLSNNTNLIDVRLRGSDNLIYANLRNGNNINIIGFDVREMSSLNCITTDDVQSQLMIDFSQGKTFSADCGNVYIPDENFEIYLETHTASGDEVQLGDLISMGDGVMNHLTLRSSVESVTSLNVNGKNISSLQGIEAFSSLEILYCIGNQLTELNLSQNTALTNLECQSNQFTSLDVSNNLALRVLGCANNLLTEIDVTKNLALTGIWCTNNLITSLNLDLNTELNLYGLSDNPLEHLSIRNGNNHNIIYSVMQNLPNLTCINVDDETADNSNLGADAHIIFSEDCGDFVYIPDPNFEQALIDLGIDSDGVVNTSILRSDAENATQLNARFPLLPDGSVNQFADPRVTITQKIEDLTGIEAFINLDVLAVEFNALTSIDVSKNTKLKDLIIAGNSISTLDLTTNALLEYLNCNNNPISNLDVSQNANLDELSIDKLLITQIDLSNNLQLAYFYASSVNNLTNIDFSVNTSLINLLINGSNLEILNLKNNSSLVFLVLNDNPQLTYLNLRNNNNMNVYYLDLTNTPNLLCINADANISQAMISSGKTFSEDCGDFVNIPDPNFEQALIDIGVDSDGIVNGSILRSDAEAITELNVSNPLFTSDSRRVNELIINVAEKIADLTGIEAFINLTKLSCWGGEITSLDLSNNPLLETIELVDNQISTINLSQNTEVTLLWLETNALTEVDISNNTKLENIAVGYNQLTSLDVSNNTELWAITAEENQLTTIDVSNNTKLTNLWVFNNPSFNSVDVSKNTLLSRVGIWGTSIEVLDLSNNPITGLWAENNLLLKHLDVRNGNNLNISTFNVSNTPLLSCINADGTSLVELSQVMLDSGKTFSADCGDFVNIPDENFELSLLELNIDSDGFLNGKILREDAELITDLNLNNPNFAADFANGDLTNVPGQISNITGIEAFVNLTNLQVSYSLINNINVSNLTQLEVLWLNDNALTAIDVQSNINLTTLGVMRNNIAGALNVSQNTQLETLYVYNNEITDLAISSNINLKDLRVNNNALTTLDISTNLTLERIDAQYNTGLNVTFPAVELISLTSLNLSGTGINRFNATLLPNLEWLLLNDNALTNFNTSKVPNIQNLRINNNQLGSLDVSSNTALIDLQVQNNLLTDLNVKNGNNTSLNLEATSNNLTCITVDDELRVNTPSSTFKLDVGVSLNLDCKGAPEVVLIPDENFELALGSADTNGLNGNILLSDALLITNLDISSENISDLTGIEAFENLVLLSVSDNNLNELNVTFNNQLEFIDCSGNNLSSIDLSQNGSLISLNIANNNLQELTISATKSLTELDCSNNSISSINLAELTSLTSLDISSNLMTTIDATGLDQLNSVNVSSNLLVELDMRNGNNTNISTFDATNNQLICIGVDDENVIPNGWFKDTSSTYTTSGDCLPPNVITQNVDIGIDAKGVANVSVTEIDFGSSDNSTPSKNLTFELTRTDTSGPAEFTCEDVGKEIQVMLTVTDLEGNFDVGFAVVNVEDYIAPVANSVRSLFFDLADGPVNIALADIEDGSTDNCGVPMLSLGDTGGDFLLPGNYIVTLTATDSYGNSSSSETEVEIIDSSISSAGLSFGKLKLTVYPVPFSDVINISFSEPTDLTIVSVSLLYFDQTNTGINFHVNGVNLISDSTTNLVQASGTIYWLQVTIGKKIQTIQIIKG